MITPLLALFAITFSQGGIPPKAPQETVPLPKTRLESFQSVTGSVIVIGNTDIGTMNELGNISVSIRELRDPSSPTRYVNGILIEVQESGRLERESQSYIDFEEITDLLKGLTFISKINKEVTLHDRFEATYSTKGDFKITVFNDNNGSLNLGISSGSISKVTAFFSIEKLKTLQELITTAKQKLIEKTPPSIKKI